MIEYPKKSKFEGDLNSNEVHVNLEKWIDVLHENGELKDRLRKLELVTQPNPWQSWIHFSIMIDSYRIFPRAFITVYMILLYYSTVWFMELPEPSIAQAGLISTMVGAGAAWFGLYTRSSGD
jgi:hypothetical protein|tara:strand:- start:113 stop:478 length:366 start_codon:yes stop_codon:yes gene_type:complete